MNNIKFAMDTYFTSMTFQEIILNQINNSRECYIHTGNYYSLKDRLKYGDYVFEKISKNQMVEFATKPDEGYKVLNRYLGFK